jgi:acetyl-CoA C-acetyltransferase
MNATTTSTRSNDDVLIAGWAHTKFGRLTDDTLESLIVRVGREALEDAGVAARDVDEIFIGNYNSGLVPLSFVSSLALEIDPDLRFAAATHVENACSSGSAAIKQGIAALRSGAARTVLVIGAEKMTHASGAEVGQALLGASYELAGQPSAGGFAAMFAEVQDAYVEQYGEVSDALAAIAAKNHANGALNPYAHMQRDLGFEFCNTVSDKNPIVIGQLRRTDCSLVSDGAAAIVLTTRDAKPDTDHPAVRFAGFAQANDFLPSARRNPTEFDGPRTAWQRALGQAGIGVHDLDLLEVHDCFTIAELLLYEALGLAEPGQGRRLIDDGAVLRDGTIPVNVSGGLKSKGHPVGATGVSQHVVSAWQLTGAAGEMQLPKVDRVGILNMGGTAVSNYASILELD